MADAGRRSAGETVVAGDDLVAFLRAPTIPEASVRIDPPPRSWAAIKPALLGFARARWRAGGKPPEILGLPLCAIGIEHREVRVRPRIGGPELEECLGCGLREKCSPPGAWVEGELQAFGPMDQLAAWSRFHDRFCAVLGLERRAVLDRMIEAVVTRQRGRRALAECLVEPSILFGEAVVPEIRAIVFPAEAEGRFVSEDAEARALLDAVRDLHALAEAPQPTALLSALERHLPFSIPSGFEAPASGAVSVKAYVRTRSLDPARVRSLVSDLEALAPPGARRGLPPDLDWNAVEIVGLRTTAGALDTLKLYVRRSPSAAWPSVGLLAVDAAHPMWVLSAGQALAVLDVAGVRARPAKWDFRLRDELLTGPRISSAFADAISERARRELSAILGGTGFHVDVVAGALRGAGGALYVEIA